MEYCTVSDVERYYLSEGRKFGCDGYITSQEVQSFIIQDATLINSMISGKYSLPITNHSDLVILQMINEKMVVGTIDDITRDKNEKGDFVRGRKPREEAMDLLNKIISGDFKLNTTRTTSVIKFNNIDSQGNTVEKRFLDSNIEPKPTYLDRERRRIS